MLTSTRTQRLSPLLLLVFLVGCAPTNSRTLSQTPSVRLAGHYTWNQGGGDEQPLAAEFTSTGSEAWDVSLRFDFNGKSQAWSGTAQGDLSTGDFSGRVSAKSMDRVWRIRGRSVDGVLRAEHAEILSDDENVTGTLELRVEPTNR